MARHALIGSKRRGTPPAVSFLSLTSWSRPTSLATTSAPHQKPFTTKAGLDAAIAAAVDGDYIYYAGTSGSPLVIPSSSGTPYTITGLNPATNITIDFGTAASIWFPGVVSGNYVEFSYTGSSNVNAFTLINSSNLTLYGGMFTAPHGNQGIINQAPLTNIDWQDVYVFHAGGSGVSFKPNTGAGAASFIRNYRLRVEVNRWALNPPVDSHTDLGTGLHACICHGNSGELSGNTYAVYGHDPLAPGEVSNGVTYGEGSGGSCLEDGTSGSGPFANNTYYVRAENMLMTCGKAPLNPGSTDNSATCGNAINWWGPVHLSNTVVGWVEGTNLSGSLTHGTPEAWNLGSIEVKHGRHTNINQYPSKGNIAVPYDRRYTVAYDVDCL